MSDRPDYIPEVRLGDYDYVLPDERIAFEPLERRDESRLLVCDKRDGSISHRSFGDLATLIPSDATLVLNDTRVVPARLNLRKESGGNVEILLIDPIEPSSDPALALAAQGESVWRCMVGGLKKIRNGEEVAMPIFFHGSELTPGTLRASVKEIRDDGVLVQFRWTPELLRFGTIIGNNGHIPLPPYIKRKETQKDRRSYQTVYAKQDGAVAAPTAGLHFTPELLAALQEKGVETLRVTLHVGAGTFAPVKGEHAHEHAMHAERISISKDALQQLIAAAERRQEGSAPLVVVGTTSVRTLESLYWFGVRLQRNEIDPETSELAIDQWDPYRLERGDDRLPSLHAALQEVETWRSQHNLEAISGVTSLMILPGYRFQACDRLITNFHQPGSTLVLLVAAFLGPRLWRQAYDTAMAEEYRFLSYGDSTFLIDA